MLSIDEVEWINAESRKDAHFKNMFGKKIRETSEPQETRGELRHWYKKLTTIFVIDYLTSWKLTPAEEWKITRVVSVMDEFCSNRVTKCQATRFRSIRRLFLNKTGVTPPPWRHSLSLWRNQVYFPTWFSVETRNRQRMDCWIRDEICSYFSNMFSMITLRKPPFDHDDDDRKIRIFTEITSDIWHYSSDDVEDKKSSPWRRQKIACSAQWRTI